MNTNSKQLLNVDFIHSSVVNFSLQQNKIPVIRKFVIRNVSEKDLQNLRVELSFDPEYAVPFTTSVLSLGKGESVSIDNHDIKLSSGFLSEMTERMSGMIKINIFSDSDNVFTNDYKIDILAFDQWQGISIIPEIISAFVTPNNPHISEIVQKASGILQSWTGNPSFDEYQSRSNDRVKKQMAAIFQSIRDLAVIYCPPPASFEESGQRIRLIDTILSHKQATCLDLTLFYASCLEAIGLHPIIVVMKGHTFTGCWLIDNYFADSINDDATLLTKRTAEGINEILLVETTQMNSGNTGTFDDAVNTANHSLTRDDDFQIFVDVTRSRLSGIRPLPQRIRTESGWEFQDEKEPDPSYRSPEEIIQGSGIISPDESGITKQQVWERRLLDLSLRNNLLNTRITKSTIQLISTDLGKLEDALAAGDEFQLLPALSDWENPLKKGALFQAVNKSDPVCGLISNEMVQKRLRTYLGENDLGEGLKSLYRSSRISLDENGANTLYLCIGFLMWYETASSELPRFSPLLLIPVDIIRKSALKGYVIKGREEETLLNITLLEMLRQDFRITLNGLDPFPRDKSGVDVKKIFNIVRQSIMMQKRWDVLEEAILGIFSFNKFIMWNDIHTNSDKLARNKIVAGLISGKAEWDTELDQVSAEGSDKLHHPSEFALPISADSSQFEAVCAAAQDKSFILHGPPGTGKSQTITNIIANSLFNGKKVLFAAEKMAALSVVQKRLESIGLGPFCIELHSNKSRKSLLLDQLKRTTEIGRKNKPEDFLAEAERLKIARDELNSHVEALHKKYNFGFSLFDAFSGYAQLKEFSEQINLDKSVISTLTKERIKGWIDLAEEIKAAGRIAGEPHGHPLSGIKASKYTIQLRDISIGLFIQYNDILNNLKKCISEAGNQLGIDLTVKQRSQIIRLKEMCSILVSSIDLPSGFLKPECTEESIRKAIAVAENGIIRNKYRDSLLKKFSKGILSIDVPQLKTEWENAEKQWFVPRLLGKQRIIRLLKQYSLTKTPAKSQVIKIFYEVAEYQRNQNQIDLNSKLLSDLLGQRWKGGDGDWQEIRNICQTVLNLNDTIPGLALNHEGIIKLRSALSTNLVNGYRYFLNSYGTIFNNCQNAVDELLSIEIKLKESLGIDFDNLEMHNENIIDNYSDYCSKWKSGIDSLRDWVIWNQVRGKAVNEGLDKLISIYEKGFVKSDDASDLLMKSLYHCCADFIIENDIRLSGFNGKMFEEKIIKFRQLNQRFEMLIRDELVARLSAKIPFFEREAALSSELGILKRNIKNGGRGTSIRKLFDTIPNLITRMSPCMLMSPISIAQYIDINNFKFDLIIFDEASQIPTCEAVTAIARGNNIIVVGDPKQMPPTNFFSTNFVDEENIEKEDLESILDDCLALSLPSRYLLWHYRSKHESLITFSNSQFYGNSLLTFPSPDDLVTKVRFIHIPGFYDRGKSRQNNFEAKAVVDEILRRLSDPDLSKRSIGVVTFSSVQQMLIDDILTDAFRQRPELESIAYDSPEPVFIKNLENVQGDERDIILFSVGYGPDRNNKITLNFGPLNREGGWRRLNVAVSRARYEMMVFSTLKADQIDISRTTSMGVAAFKSFLEFAEKGKNVLTLPTQSKVNIRGRSGLTDQIAKKLIGDGYNVVTEIGCSGFKIDIGITHPDKSSEYLLGILCDGYNYSESKTARDREIIREEVLKSLGWRIHRVWSCDWWDNQARVLEDIRKAIRTLTDSENIGDNVKKDELLKSSVEKVTVPVSTATKNFTEVAKYRKTYRKTSLQTRSFRPPSDLLELPNFLNSVRLDIRAVLETEAPVSRELLCRRIITIWSVSRMGSRIEAFFNSLLREMKIKHTGSSKLFFWNDDQNPESYMVYRVSSDDTERREATDIPPEEISVAIKEILENQISMTREDLVKETARVFGYNRTGGNVESSMLWGINKAVSRGFVKIEGQRIRLSE